VIHRVKSETGENRAYAVGFGKEQILSESCNTIEQTTNLPTAIVRYHQSSCIMTDTKLLKKSLFGFTLN
jgi:hypothetical protein